jgi:hypothetical protein
VLWVEVPVNQTMIACKSADDHVRKATPETSFYWQQAAAKTPGEVNSGVQFRRY